MQRLDRAIQEKYEVLQAANTNYENFVKKSEVGHFFSSFSKILLLLNGKFTKTKILGKNLICFSERAVGTQAEGRQFGKGEGETDQRNPQIVVFVQVRNFLTIGKNQI